MLGAVPVSTYRVSRTCGSAIWNRKVLSESTCSSSRLRHGETSCIQPGHTSCGHGRAWQLQAPLFVLQVLVRVHVAVGGAVPTKFRSTFARPRLPIVVTELLASPALSQSRSRA